jgi:hypothetical protein
MLSSILLFCIVIKIAIQAVQSPHGVRLTASGFVVRGGRAIWLGVWLLGLVLSCQSAAIAGEPAQSDDPVGANARCTPQPDVLKPLAAEIKPNLVSFSNSPFPYDGEVPADHKPFLDYNKDGRRGHTSPRGNLHLEQDAYSNKNSLLYLPKGFDLSRPEQALIVVFFHGNYVELMRDVNFRQRVPAQLAHSGLNAALVAPQFALGIPDSSAGRFWQPGVFNQYLAEAAKHLAELLRDPCTEAKFNELGVILVA